MVVIFRKHQEGMGICCGNVKWDSESEFLRNSFLSPESALLHPAVSDIFRLGMYWLWDPYTVQLLLFFRFMFFIYGFIFTFLG